MCLRGLTEFARGVAGLIFPNSCLICDAPEAEPSDFRHGLCNNCNRGVTNDPHRSCSLCAATIGPHTDVASGCPTCSGFSFGFSAAMRLGPYDGQLRQAILRMKSSSGDGLAEMMGQVLFESLNSRFREFRIDLVVPVPLHWRRRLVRGYNQAGAIARELAHRLGVNYAPWVIRRIRHTPQQVQPSAAARRANVRGAFWVGSGAKLSGRTVLLVDDVMTTGHTASEVARTLRAAGADDVVVAVLARR